MLRARFIAPVAAIALLTAPAAAQAKTTISMSGSTSIYPLALKLATAYHKANASIAFKLLQGGTDTGINDVSKGRVTIGNASRDPESSDPGGLVFNKIARDAVCMITNPKNPLANLSQEQVQAIFSGRVSTWDQVPGATSKGAIKVVTRTATSGTADAFKNIFLGPSVNVLGAAQQKGTNGLVQQTIASDANTIGYVSLDFLSGVAPVGYQGVPCSLRNAKSGQYAGVRNFWMVTRGKATGAAASWIKWIQTNATARTIINTDWISIK